MNIELFDSSMLAPMVHYLAQNGGRCETVLDQVRIPGELIDRGGWVTKKQAYDFAWKVVEQSGRQDAIFSAYLGFEFKHLGPVAAAMKQCKTVKEALDVGTRLAAAAYEGNKYFLRTEGETTWICYEESRCVSAGQTYINDMTLTVYLNLIRAVADKDWRPERMVIRREQIDRHLTANGFENCRAAYHPHYSAIAFPTRFLHRRSPWRPGPDAEKPRAERSTCSKDELSANGWPGYPPDCGAIENALYRLVASRLPFRALPTLWQTAQMLGCSPATIKRNLQAAGTSYQGLLDRVRFDSACQLLATPQLSVREIGLELGYSGTNNFVRSFQRMTGLTPGAYRRQCAKDLEEGAAQNERPNNV